MQCERKTVSKKNHSLTRKTYAGTVLRTGHPKIDLAKADAPEELPEELEDLHIATRCCNGWRTSYVDEKRQRMTLAGG